MRPDEVQPISANGTIRTGRLDPAINGYHLCLGNATEIGTAPRDEFGGVWPANFSQQFLVRLSATNTRNFGAGHNQGIYTNQELALRATTSAIANVQPATKSGAIKMQPPRLPTQLQLLGPKKDSREVRGVPFQQQPVVKVVGVDGRVFADATGSVVLQASGTCQPQLSGTTTSPLVNGIATFTDITLSTIACLNEMVVIEAQIDNTVAGTSPFLGLGMVQSAPFQITPGAPHRLIFATENNVAKNDVEITRNTLDGSPCMPAFELGAASISAIVRDAQDSPVNDYAMPIDLRLCDAPTVEGGTPTCPAAHAALVGTVQVTPVDGFVLFNNFSVTNISAGFVLSLYTPLLEVDYSIPLCGVRRWGAAGACVRAPSAGRRLRRRAAQLTAGPPRA